MRALRALFFSLVLLTTAAVAYAAPVDINTADAQTLAQAIKGIGPQKAAAIVTYREQHGPFKSVDDLTQVKGIGQKTIDANRQAITAKDQAVSM
ncbi:MAG: helix-hairpin-helix domain-containing protein, partial [Ktedonobacterales bacterium]|nr:helix-hairpin-helix domain-containing protein [Ktedonobacterales bacterium]